MFSKQFFHGMKHKAYEKEFTFCMLVPNRELLLLDIWKLLANKENSVQYGIGVSMVHPNDFYNKKFGRQVSSSRIEYVDFKLSHATMNENIKMVELKNDNFYIILEIRDDKTKVRLIDVFIK